MFGLTQVPSLCCPPSRRSLSHTHPALRRPSTRHLPGVMQHAPKASLPQLSLCRCAQLRQRGEGVEAPLLRSMLPMLLQQLLLLVLLVLPMLLLLVLPMLLLLLLPMLLLLLLLLLLEPLARSTRRGRGQPCSSCPSPPPICPPCTTRTPRVPSTPVHSAPLLLRLRESRGGGAGVRGARAAHARAGGSAARGRLRPTALHRHGPGCRRPRTAGSWHLHHPLRS